MDMIQEVEKIHLSIPEKANANELLNIFNQYADKIKVLSLDCFDTLLWRKAASPMDVFYDLQHKPTFKSLGISPTMRIRAEGKARALNNLEDRYEVQLDEIYRNIFPDLNDEQLKQLAEEEISAEIETLYAFQPVVELIRAAHAKGIKIIIVSDIYFKEAQLTRLLTAVLPQDAMAAISKIFCSADFGVTKTSGLFKHVLNQLQVPAEAMLHIGDNYNTDFQGAKNHNINALHFIQQNEHLTELFRMHAASAAIFDPSIRYERGLVNPFKDLLATAKLAADKPEELIGYVSLGQIMYAFGRFIIDEIAALEREGKHPKVLFLMRDAYLPSLVCEKLAGKPFGKRVRISRFGSIAATFCAKEDVDNYIMDVVHTGRFEDIARQLLIPEDVAKRLISIARNSENPTQAFANLLHQEETLNIIFSESKKYRSRLKRYLEKEVDLKAGDTLVLVDLGYTGTTQVLLEPVLRREMNIDVLGRYLIAVRIPDWDKNRRGLLDASWIDERCMHTLINYIALLEQACTCNEGSVVDYDEDGNVVYSNAVLSEQQHNKLDRLQSECLRFVQDASNKYNDTIPISILRENAVAELGRLLFFPSKAEINYFETFEFDLNCGTTDTFRVFDQSIGLTSLRRRGLFFSFMEKKSVEFRTNSPAEMRAAGLELSLALLMHHRLGLEFGLKDVNLRKEKINIILARGKESTQSTVEATGTHDGYFAIWLPVGNANIQVAIVFGHHYQWVQIDSAELIETSAFLKPNEGMHTTDCWSTMHFNQMNKHGENLYECSSTSSFMMMAPQNKPEDKKYVLRVVFRPTIRR